MQREDMKHDHIIFADGIGACASLMDQEYGKLIHTHIIKTRFEFEGFIGSSIVDMYAKCKSIEDAQHVFDNAAKRDLVSWNGMIGGYA